MEKRLKRRVQKLVLELLKEVRMEPAWELHSLLTSAGGDLAQADDLHLPWDTLIRDTLRQVGIGVFFFHSFIHFIVIFLLLSLAIEINSFNEI